MRSLCKCCLCLAFWVLCWCTQLPAQEVDGTGAKGSSIEQRLSAVEKELEDMKGGSGLTLRGYWDHGIRFKSLDGRFKLKLGGRIQNDWTFWSTDHDQPVLQDLNDGVEFRRARIYLQGTIYDRILFKAQYDFAGGSAHFKDMYIGLDDVPHLGEVLVGQFKQPFCMGELTSSKYLTFIERATAAEAFAPSRNTGIGFHSTCDDQRVTYAAGFYRTTDNFGKMQQNGDSNLSVRVTGLPVYQDDGKTLVHLGLAYSFRNPGSGMTSFSSKPEVHLAQDLVDTGDLPVKNYHLVGVEGATVLGPFSAQGEWIHATVMIDGPGANPDFDGFYVQGSYFLTGEHRPYKRSEGVFDRVIPKKDFLEEGGMGALELAARYSYINLQDGRVVNTKIAGGRLSDVTLALNWYLNPNTRFMTDVVFVSPGPVAGTDVENDVTAFSVRFQVDF